LDQGRGIYLDLSDIGVAFQAGDFPLLVGGVDHGIRIPEKYGGVFRESAHGVFGGESVWEVAYRRRVATPIGPDGVEDGSVLGVSSRYRSNTFVEVGVHGVTVFFDVGDLATGVDRKEDWGTYAQQIAFQG